MNQFEQNHLLHQQSKDLTKIENSFLRKKQNFLK
jgi:hypothetical protein